MPVAEVTRRSADSVPSAFRSTPQFVAWFAQTTPDATAVIEDSRAVTYRTLADDLARSIATLLQLGVRTGALVGIEDRPERYLQLVLRLACHALGATITPVGRQDLGNADDPVLPGCALLLLNAPHSGQYAKVAKIVPSTFLDRLAEQPVRPEVMDLLQRPPDPDRIALISRTSGTTGRRKAVPVTERVLQGIITSGLDGMPEGARTCIRFLCLYNLAVRAAWTRCLRALQSGGTVIFSNETDAPQLLNAGVANLILLLVGNAERIAKAATAAPRSAAPVVEFIGSRVEPRIRQLVRDRLHAHVIVRYGSNETNGIAVIGHDGVGMVRAGVSVMIVDDAGDPLPVGETGHIRVRTPVMADSYYNDPEQTRAAFIDGWYNTNDIGYLPEPGRIVVLGRADDMLNIGGIKIPPLPLEEKIKQIAGIADAVVLNAPDSGGADMLVAAVELGSGGDASTVAVAVAGILSGYVRRHRVLLLPSLPRTDTGKVRRQDVAAAIRPGADQQQ
ncbi:MAG: class I adenylate-forming enzyme family protein [Acetobacteraceae bacterium]